MHHVSMAKLSTQLLADQPTERPTRSSRVRSFQADERERKKIEAYNQGLKNAKIRGIIPPQLCEHIYNICND